MKFYETVNINLRNNGDELQLYAGTDLEAAQEAKHRADVSWANATKRDQESTVIELRVYEIPDDTDINDQDAVVDALVECSGYNLI